MNDEIKTKTINDMDELFNPSIEDYMVIHNGSARKVTVKNLIDSLLPVWDHTIEVTPINQ